MVELATIRKGAISKLSKDARETIDGVLAYYGDKSAQWLSDLTHMEAPWKMTRERANLTGTMRGDAEIQLADMHEYYSGI